MTLDNSLVEFDNVSASVDVGFNRTRELFRNLSFSLHKDNCISIVGPNGSGKSTILKLVLGHILPSNGFVQLHISTHLLAYIPQNYKKALFPWCSVSRNIELYATAPRFDRSIFANALDTFALDFSSGQSVYQLSGGEQQLLSLALALARRPEILLLDEPFSAVDIKRRPLARILLQQEIRKRGSAALLVTHDLDDAAFLSQAAVVLPGINAPASIVTLGDTKNSYQEALADALAK